LDGRVQLTISSTPGFSFWLDRTTNLFNWLPLTNLFNTNGTSIYTDGSATDSAGFYRVRQ
jgi:hypothetical protein